MQFSYTIYQNMPQMEFKVEISLKPDKSENYCFCYQWDGHLPVTTSQEECSCMMWSPFSPADRLAISLCEVGKTLLSNVVGKPSCCSFCFGEKGCLSSREAHWLKHFANRHEFKSTSCTAEKESPTQGGARAFSGCCRGLGIRQQPRELQAESRTSQVHEGLDKGDCRRFWCIVANLFVILFSPPQLRASSVLYLFVYFKGICYKNFSLMATFS